VSEIGAGMLFPIHTEHPEAYRKVVPKITLVREGITYKL